MAATIQFTCPHCESQMSVPSGSIGQQGECLSCQAFVLIQSDSTTASAFVANEPSNRNALAILSALGCGAMLVAVFVLVLILVVFLAQTELRTARTSEADVEQAADSSEETSDGSGENTKNDSPAEGSNEESGSRSNEASGEESSEVAGKESSEVAGKESSEAAGGGSSEAAGGGSSEAAGGGSNEGSGGGSSEAAGGGSNEGSGGGSSEGSGGGSNEGSGGGSSEGSGGGSSEGSGGGSGGGPSGTSGGGSNEGSGGGSRGGGGGAFGGGSSGTFSGGSGGAFGGGTRGGSSNPETEPVNGMLEMSFVKIPAGTFLMGSPMGAPRRNNDETQHKVVLTKSFYMQTTEVTQGQWKSIMGTEPWKGQEFSGHVLEGVDQPATYLKWGDAVAFCKTLSARVGRTYRLPTEAEWEYACRAGSKDTWTYGNNEKSLGDYAWYDKNAWDIGEKHPHQVGLKKPNAFGLFDMHGNVHEWCSDYYGADYYKQSPKVDPLGPTQGTFHVLRGGSVFRGSRSTRSAFRNRYVTDYQLKFVFGFRLLVE